MPQLLPNRFLFKFEFPLHRTPREKPLPLDGEPAAWGLRYLLPPLHTIDDEPTLGRVFAAWDPESLYIACIVEGKKRPPNCNPDRFRESDCLRLMTDMRDTRDIRRASRFCQHFYFLPTGAGSKGNSPVAGAAKIARATQDAPLPPSGQIQIASKITKTGYSLTARIPGPALCGFDPAENPRIGLYYRLEDAELGSQSLTIGDDLNWWCDPGTWPTAVLTE